ncbi:MAG: chemoreceptor glutamine deamidase CheD [bacterium]|nr:chemoreceptor glutamine deamidase CheD [bacterium]
MEHYFDRRFDCDGLKLLPGEFAIATDGEMLVTVLGSCVAACIWDTESGVGGMNHFMLPHSQSGDGGAAISYLSYSGRYGVNAMEMLVNGIIRRGGDRTRLAAKLFGGASVLAALDAREIGEENARFATAYLETERIPLVASDLRGHAPRRVHFWPTNGDARVRYLGHESADAGAIQEHEGRYARRLAERREYGSVDIFDIIG